MGKNRCALVCLAGVFYWLLLTCAWGTPAAQFSIYRVADADIAAEQVVSGVLRSSEIASPMSAFAPLPRVQGWWRIEFTVLPTSGQRYYFYLNTLGLVRSQVYMPDGRMVSISQLELSANQGFSPRIQAVELPSQLKVGDSIYWHVQTRDQTPITAAVMAENDLRRLDAVQSRWHSLTEGIILSLVLAGFALSALLREKNFILLSAGTFFSWLFVIVNNGNIYHYPLLPGWEVHLSLAYIFGFSCTLLLIYFVYVFLDMRVNAPRLAAILRAAMAVFGALLICSFIPGSGNIPHIALIANITVIVAIITIASASVLMVLRGNRSGRLLLVSWAPLFVFGLWRALELSLGYQENQALSLLFPASFVLACVLMYSGLGERMLYYKRERDVSEQLARMDSLTDVYNRRALDERLLLAAQSSERTGADLALLFIDIDHFKTINDMNGHDVGDAVLKIITQRIRTVLRFGDVLGRYGGEEFVIALPDCDSYRARMLAERVRQCIADEPFCYGDITLSVTVSIGVSVLQGGQAGIELALKHADQALYQSKQNGRNQVIAHS
jgi:diguanylate cyclase (GGDEF)-like protein